MEDFFSGIGFIAVVGAIIYFLALNSEKKADEKRENEELFRYVGGSENFDEKLSRSENIKKRLKEPGVRKYAEEQRAMGMKIRAEEEDKRRKEKILNRTYSYQYEDLIYEIFSPLAVMEENKFMAKDYGKWRVHRSMDRFFFLSEISRILNVSEDEAIELLFQFEKHDMIDISNIPNTWKKACSMGNLLAYDWDIISKQDKNISVWMDSHPNVESKESFERRHKEFVDNKYKS